MSAHLGREYSKPALLHTIRHLSQRLSEDQQLLHNYAADFAHVMAKLSRKKHTSWAIRLETPDLCYLIAQKYGCEESYSGRLRSTAKAVANPSGYERNSLDHTCLCIFVEINQYSSMWFNDQLMQNTEFCGAEIPLSARTFALSRFINQFQGHNDLSAGSTDGADLLEVLNLLSGKQFDPALVDIAKELLFPSNYTTSNAENIHGRPA